MENFGANIKVDKLVGPKVTTGTGATTQDTAYSMAKYAKGAVIVDACLESGQTLIATLKCGTAAGSCATTVSAVTALTLTGTGTKSHKQGIIEFDAMDLVAEGATYYFVGISMVTSGSSTDCESAVLVRFGNRYKVTDASGVLS